MSTVWWEGLHVDGWSGLFDFGHKQGRRLPCSSLRLINMDRAYFGSYWQVFSFRAVIDTRRYLSRTKRSQNTDRFRFFVKVPFIKGAILTRNDKRIWIRPNSWTNDRRDNRLHQYDSFFLLLVNFLEQTRFEHGDSGIIIHHNKIIAHKFGVVFVFVRVHMTVTQFIVAVFRYTRERYRVDCSEVDILEPGLNSVLVVIKADRAIGRAYDQEPSLNFEDGYGWRRVDFFHLVNFVRVIH